MPLATALQVDLDALLDVRSDDDVLIRPTPNSSGERTTWMLSRPTGSTIAVKMRLEPTRKALEQRVHPGHDWFFVIDGRVRLSLGEREITVETGEAAEFGPDLPGDIEYVHVAQPAVALDFGPVAHPGCGIRPEQGRCVDSVYRSRDRMTARFDRSRDDAVVHECVIEVQKHRCRPRHPTSVDAADVPRGIASDPSTSRRSGTVGCLSGKSGCVAHETIEGDGVVLRPTTDDDLATLRGFFKNPGFYDRWGGGKALSDEEMTAKYLGGRSPAVECFIVEESGRPVGFVQYHVADDAGEGGGMDLALLPVERDRGVGTAVVQAVVEFVRRQLGWQRFTVDPDVSNIRGVAFWRKVGFTPVRLVDDEPEREPYWLMEWPQRTW